MLGVVHDEDALDVQLDATALVSVPQIEWCAGRDIQQLGVLAAAFDAIVRVGQRRFEIMRNVLVKLDILLRRDVVLVAGPQRAGLIDGFQLRLQHGLFLFLVPLFFLHLDRQRDVVGILADDRLEFPGRQKFIFAFAQVQGDCGATIGLVNRFNGEIAGAGRFPADAVGSRLSGAPRVDGNAVGDDECRVEADPELTNQCSIFLLVTGQSGEEFLGAGFGDRTEMFDGFLATHPDAVVGDRDGAGGFIKTDLDLQIGVVFKQFAVIDCLEAQLVGRIGGVRDKFPQENFLVRVQGVNHQLQQLFDFRLEAQGLLFGCNHFYL